MGYQSEPDAAISLWGKPGRSTITQPPMYGHAIRVLHDAGVQVPDELIDAAIRGVEHLLSNRLRNGLAVIVHPWESGCDDSARWGDWMPRPYAKPAWDETKRKLIDTAVKGPAGGSIANPDFEVAAVSFNALLAFNLRELAHVTSSTALALVADDLASQLEARWDGAHRTWRDGAHSSGTAPTLESLLPLLVIDRGDQVADAWSAIQDPDWFGAPYGPRQTARVSPAYDPDAYWRGPTWPQLNYLLWVAARRQGRHEEATHLAEMTVRGARQSGFAEYWNPETGEGRGAIPQSWTGLAWVLQWASA
jgi:hypothetical protein